jgi:uncharacterized protein (TIGR04255 family)
MALNFPQKQEVKLNKAPLDEVVCQVKFPPILRISKELPIDFQEVIRPRFPGLEIEQILFQFSQVGALEKSSLENPPKVYRFSSADGKSSVALATDFYAISTKGYTHWSEFIRDLSLVENAVTENFHPSYATRIGLRFINKFTRINTNSETQQQILDLFREELTCLLRADGWLEPDDMFSQLLISDNQAKLTFRIGYGKDQMEPFFILDFDYFEEGQIQLDNLITRMNQYHSRIYDAFRWSIKDESLARFEPITEG